MKLTYFNGRGLAETSRVLLAISGQPYEDFRYPLNVIDWHIFKMERPEFDEDKSAGNLWKSMNKLPFLEVDGQVIFQSKAIERYLANLFGFMGSSPLESAFIDSICETIRDLKDNYPKVRDTNDSAFQTYFVDYLPNVLLSINNIIKSRNNDVDSVHYVIGNQLSLADVTLFLFLTDFFGNNDLVTKAYKNLEVLNSIVENIGNINSIKKWLEVRPVTPF
jgi:glutathione S-transferase